MDVVKLKSLLKYSYSPYSKFKVAAIAIDENGNEYVGVNVENPSYSSAICAERAAFAAAVAKGAKVGTFKEIHIISSKKDFISPCGVCRQVITEFMPDIAKVYQYNGEGDKCRVNTVGQLIPHAVRGDLFE